MRAHTPRVKNRTLPQRHDPAHEQWLDAIVPLREAAALRGVHIDTLKRAHAQGKLELLRVSARKWGVRRRVALMK
jgi:hypothetical protein